LIDLVWARQGALVVIEKLVERPPDTILDPIGASIAHIDVLGIGLNDFYSELDRLRFARDDASIGLPILRSERENLDRAGGQTWTRRLSRVTTILTRPGCSCAKNIEMSPPLEWPTIVK
jgi:hypothetical protein